MARHHPPGTPYTQLYVCEESQWPSSHSLARNREEAGGVGAMAKAHAKRIDCSTEVWEPRR